MPFLNLMAKGDPEDPLLLQVLPSNRERLKVEGFSPEPLLESAYNPVPGIIHKYQGRVLLITTPACAIHCRYCFRRHFPYEDNTPGKSQWQKSLAYIGENSSISEVILSGGDPLACDDRHLEWLVQQIEAIPHIKRLRIHSRLPVVIPSRIDDHLLRWLGATRLKVAVVLHLNHPNETRGELKSAVSKLNRQGIAVLNQTVLLKGINDTADTLVELSEALFAIGVLPYYLHLLDPVEGASHFDLDEINARSLFLDMQKKLPGYLLPRLVRDVPGQQSKVTIAPQNL
jgi:EF-P beta-lysylation protein EpmB